MSYRKVIIDGRMMGRSTAIREAMARGISRELAKSRLQDGASTMAELCRPILRTRTTKACAEHARRAAERRAEVDAAIAAIDARKAEIGQ